MTKTSTLPSVTANRLMGIFSVAKTRFVVLQTQPTNKKNAEILLILPLKISLKHLESELEQLLSITENQLRKMRLRTTKKKNLITAVWKSNSY